MSIKAFAFAATAAILLLSGCATPRVEQMTVTAPSGPSAPMPEVLRKNIAYSPLGGWFHEALAASLRQAGLLQSDGQSARFRLNAQLLTLERPGVGFNTTASTTAHYRLVDESTSKSVFDMTIVKPYTAPFLDDPSGLVRARLAFEGTTRANIAEFMGELTRLDPLKLAVAEPASSPTSTGGATPPTPAAPESVLPATVVAANATVPPDVALPQGQVGEGCSNSSQCAGSLRCREQRCAEPEKRVSISSPSQAPPATSSPTSAAPSAPVPERADVRAAEMKSIYASLMQQARSGKLRYLQAARLYKEKLLKLYPEESGNTFINEYLAYMAVVGERIDKKKLTEAEAEYELARKESELAERVSAMRAQGAAQEAVAKANEDAAARKAAEQAAAQRTGEEAIRQAQFQARRQEAVQLEAVRQQAALAAAIQAQADEARRANLTAIFLEGVRLLTPPPPLPPPRTTNCRWFASNWVCN